MKKLKALLLFACLCFAWRINAQLSIEKQDSIAKLICKLESATERKTYSDGRNDYSLSFPEESFGFNYENGKAWKAVYKTHGSDIYLVMTENIDLSKVTGFTWDRSLTSRVLMHFPKGTIKTAVSKNSGDIYMIEEDFLEFFCLEDLKMLLPLAEACHIFKVAQGKIKESDIKRFGDNFSALMNLPPAYPKRLLLEYDAFMKNNENSLFVPIVKEYIKSTNEVQKHWEEAATTKSFCDSLCKAFLYKPDLYSGAQFEAYNPTVKKLMKNKNHIPTREGNGMWSSSNTDPGPSIANFRKNGLIYTYNFGYAAIGTDLYNNRMKWLESKIPKSFIDPFAQPNGARRIHILHDKKDPCIEFYFHYYDGKPFEWLTFSLTEYNTTFHP
jgi:hypothetical protein